MSKLNRNGITELQQAFADAYLRMPFNKRTASGAYKAIKPKATIQTAEVQGCRMLRMPMVAKYVDDRTNKIINDIEAKQLVTHADIVTELMHVGFSRLTDVTQVDEDGNIGIISTDDWGEASKAGLKTLRTQTINHGEGEGAIKTQKTEITFHDKLKSLEMLARYKNMFKDDQESGSGGGMVILPADLNEEEWAKQVQKQKEK